MIAIGAYCGTPIVAEGLRSVIKRLRGFCFSGVSSEIHSFLRTAGEKTPDIVFLEVDSAVTLELLQQITVLFPLAATVLLVGIATTEFISQALTLGVRGVLGSSSTVKNYADCLIDVHKGLVWVEKSISQNLLHIEQVALTPRQRQIMGLVSQGLHNKEIGWSLGITENTVKAYVSRLLDKFGVNDRVTLALIALRNIAANDQTALRSIRNAEQRTIPHKIPRYLIA